jgi:hypothetical protein
MVTALRAELGSEYTLHNIRGEEGPCGCSLCRTYLDTAAVAREHEIYLRNKIVSEEYHRWGEFVKQSEANIRADERERNCRAVCGNCNAGIELIPPSTPGMAGGSTHKWRHEKFAQRPVCEADAIRKEGGHR